MKKLFTFACAAVVALGSFAAPARIQTPMRAVSLSPELEQLNKELLSNAEITSPAFQTIKKKSWSDSKTKSNWTLEISNTGYSLGDAFNWGTAQSPYHPTIEEMPYYLVTMLFRKSPTTQDGNNIETMSAAAIYYLLWPCYEYWASFPNYYAGLIDEMPDNYDMVSFEDMANIHENELDPSVTYCTTFKESTEIGYYNPFPDGWGEERDGYIYPNGPRPDSWQIWYADGIVNNQSATSGFDQGSQTWFDFIKWDEDDQWLETDGMIYLNGTIRLNFSYNGTARVNGWDHNLRNLQTPSAIHIFNAGVGSSEIAGDEDIFGVVWGPLQQYYVYGCGQYVELYYGQATEDSEAISAPFNRDYLSPFIKGNTPETATSDEIQNFFFGTLFAPEDADIEKGGHWTLLKPFTLEGTTFTTVKPEGYCFTGWNSTYGDQDGFAFINQGMQDYPTYPTEDELEEGITKGNFITLGTTEGMEIYFFNGYNDFFTSYKGDIIYHYDPEDMLKIKTFSAVGELDPGADAVNEIAAENAAPVYFNLQGVRVANPEKGLFIKVEGNKAAKVLF